MENEFIPLLNCDDGQFLPIPEGDIDCPPDNLLSEVQTIYISDLANNGAVYPATWTLTASWTAVIDNAGDSTKIKYLNGKGSVTQADPTERIRAGHRKSYGESQYTLTFTLDDSSQLTYEQLQYMEASSAMVRLWFKTVGGAMFGAPQGIICNVKRTPFVLNEGEEAYEQYQIILGWKSKTRPVRLAVSPI